MESVTCNHIEGTDHSSTGSDSEWSTDAEVCKMVVHTSRVMNVYILHHRLRNIAEATSRVRHRLGETVDLIHVDEPEPEYRHIHCVAVPREDVSSVRCLVT